MKKNNIINCQLTVTQIRSSIKMTSNQKSSLKGLGLKTVGDTVTLTCDESIYGMIKSVTGFLKISKL